MKSHKSVENTLKPHQQSPLRRSASVDNASECWKIQLEPEIIDIVASWAQSEVMSCEKCCLHTNKHTIHELLVSYTSYTGTSGAVVQFQTHTPRQQRAGFLPIKMLLSNTQKPKSTLMPLWWLNLHSQSNVWIPGDVSGIRFSHSTTLFTLTKGTPRVHRGQPCVKVQKKKKLWVCKVQTLMPLIHWAVTKGEK